MKRMIIPAFVLLFSVQTFSQDVLTMRSGAKYEVKLLEITDHDLRFKMYNNPEGPLYTISRSSFASIRYQNGVTEEFAKQVTGDEQTVDINGYNVSATGATSDEPLTASAGDDLQQGSRQAAVRGRGSAIGQVVGALFNTGLIVLDIAAEFQAAKRCAQQHAHAQCSKH